MSWFDRFKRRVHLRPVADPAPRVPPPPPAPLAAAATNVAPPARPVARPAMRLMLADGSVEELQDPDMEARAEYLIQSMLPPPPPPPPVPS